jgi:hypothetical protein
MRERYDLAVTRYICNRRRCKTTIDVHSDTFYWFSGEGDPNFWCPTCQDFPSVAIVGCPAQDLPQKLQLLKQFDILLVPRLEPADDVDSSNRLYRPYSKRSFLRQYIDWIKGLGLETHCDFRTGASCFKKFDIGLQRYTDEVDYEIIDECDSARCRFLTTQSLKPLRAHDLDCTVLQHLCDTKGPYGLCQTGDEAQILHNYLILTGGDHFPMLVPQAAILTGRRRADFLCFLPITKFQYRPVAILVDRPGKNAKTTEAENREYEGQDYSVYRILIDHDDPSFSYFKAARDLKNWLECVPACSVASDV